MNQSRRIDQLGEYRSSGDRVMPKARARFFFIMRRFLLKKIASQLSLFFCHLNRSALG